MLLLLLVVEVDSFVNAIIAVGTARAHPHPCCYTKPFSQHFINHWILIIH